MNIQPKTQADVLEALRYLARATGRGMGLPMGQEPSSSDATSSSGSSPSRPCGRRTSLLIHLCLSVGFGLLYAVSLEHLLQPTGWLPQALLPVAHRVISVSIRGLMPAFSLFAQELAPEPGFFLAMPGAFGLLAFVALHLCCSLILGEVYGFQGRSGEETAARAPSPPVPGPHPPTSR